MSSNEFFKLEYKVIPEYQLEISAWDDENNRSILNHVRCDKNPKALIDDCAKELTKRNIAIEELDNICMCVDNFSVIICYEKEEYKEDTNLSNPLFISGDTVKKQILKSKFYKVKKDKEIKQKQLKIANGQKKELEKQLSNLNKKIEELKGN